MSGVHGRGYSEVEGDYAIDRKDNQCHGDSEKENQDAGSLPGSFLVFEKIHSGSVRGLRESGRPQRAHPLSASSPI